MTSKLGNLAFGVIRPDKYMESQANKEAAAQQLKNAEEMRRGALNLTQQMNWQPNYVSDAIRPYQRAQSPVARSFLESLLTGANPSMVQSTRLGADRQKAAAQGAFNQQFGGWDQLEAQQRQLAQQTPWAVTPPQTPVQKLPNDYAPEAPVDKSGSTPEAVAELQKRWGADDDYWKRLEAAVGHPVPHTFGRG